MQKKKIILDTNLYISFLISKKLDELVKLIEENLIVILYSDELISEIIRVTSKTKFQKYFTADVYKLLELVFEKYGILIKITSDILICRDPDDNFLLNLAVDGNADYLITGDKDLMILEKINNTEIITIADFKFKL